MRSVKGSVITSKIFTLVPFPPLKEVTIAVVSFSSIPKIIQVLKIVKNMKNSFRRCSVYCLIVILKKWKRYII